MDDKVIVTNRAALTAKYAAKGNALINTALRELIAADKKRGINTRVIYLDDAKTMKTLNAKAVNAIADPRSAKAAIDQVFKKLKPDYLMILGASDVVPHQDLKNPAFSAGEDDDKQAWGDLPYACDQAYGTDPAQFVGATRVVSRLPDLTGAHEPSHLIALLKTATNWKSRPASDYTSYFALSALVWQGSTRLSLDNTFGNNTSLKLAPPSGPKYSAGQLGALMHFINCHGANAAPEFYGQKGKSYPVSLNTKSTARSIRDGTVASVECCYGAQLYDSVTLRIDMPICQSYLRQGCYGYLGSTTIAYGPEDGNGSADLICQYFLLNVLAGASIGRAALLARQQFVDHASQMDPIDLKTLAQFCVYGDPSVHPVVTIKRGASGPKTPQEDTSERFRRHERREKLKQTGDFLLQTKPTASKRETGARTSKNAKQALANLANKAGLPRSHAFMAFKVKGSKRLPHSPAKAATAPSRYFVTIGRQKSKGEESRFSRVAIVAKELGGRIIDYCIYHQR